MNEQYNNISEVLEEVVESIRKPIFEGKTLEEIFAIYKLMKFENKLSESISEENSKKLIQKAGNYFGETLLEVFPSSQWSEEKENVVEIPLTERYVLEVSVENAAINYLERNSTSFSEAYKEILEVITNTKI
ncbi:hypothetical protein [Ornithinibacillus halophilus]|uniref:Uncharacterized protein n=1 Tax=Ornithinibacillus halophilus TaxID=930117 RepID=A0A1M5G459_9BACI|nr:hypothetical protein [Ornithinibacillus halophilus]SHF98222.1 hypothetical protein SAMN05216225_101147 [Ornithinibacillus halophilus]